MTARLEVGRIGRAHGLHGELHITPISTHPDRFVPGATLYVGDRAYVIAASRPHQQHWLIRFEGVDDRTAAEALRNRVVIAHEHVRIFDVAGRKVFVPLIAFNALYRWSGGDGQSSISYLLGRDTKGEKMAPFRLDLGPRVFRGIGARPLPVGVRK
jgi:hypothetical protein